MIENLPGEEWRDIPGREGRYFISNKGRVLSHKRREPRLLSPTLNSYGYPQIGFNENGARKNYLVHRLVMLAFQPIENPDDFEVNHMDFDKLNGCLENLEWTTKLQNVRHFMASGRPKDKSKNTGGNHHLSVLTDADVLEIRRLCAINPRKNKAVAEQFGISDSTVRQIKMGVTWRHLLQEPA